MTILFDTTNIKQTLQTHLQQATHSIEIAMAWFTDTDLAAALQAAVRRGVRVCLLLHEDKINRASRIDWDALSAAGVAMYWYDKQVGTMHHKFCVVDKRHCLFGTYNWTYAAANYNQESFMCLDNETTAADFRQELEKLLQDSCTVAHQGTTTAYTFLQDIVTHPKIAELLEDWIVRYKGQNVYPPTVINITDGHFTDASNAEMLTSAQRITNLKTIDGNVLLFNLHISTQTTEEVIFPYKKEELPENDDFAHVLFDMSSDLPDVYNLEIAKLRGIDLMQSFTGMAYNASLDKLVAMMNIGTSTTTRQIQQHV